MDMVVVAGGSGIAGFALGYALFRFGVQTIRKSAEHEASLVLSKAKSESETIKKQAELDGMETVQKHRSKLDQKHSRRMSELAENERTVKDRRKELDKDAQQLAREKKEYESKHNDLSGREKKVEAMSIEYSGLLNGIRKRLEEVSGMSRDAAKAELVESMVADARRDAAKKIVVIEEETKESADEKARNILALAMQRISSEFAVERTVSVVNIPDDRVKGRIIGREGRNIRTFENLTGVDLIIDDTPDAVVLSCHSPLRREIARQSLEKLIEDGRIHPGRIEEIIRQVSKDVEKVIKDSGQKAIFELDIKKLHPELVRLMGLNMYRTSYAQNILSHSVEVGFMCGIMAAEIGVNQADARRAGFLHDIGKAVDKELEGAHADIGADLCKKYGEKPHIVAAVRQHHDDRPESALGVLVQVADSLSAARPGARREIMASYISRLEDLETIATKHNGVEKAFAIQAGRELRILVESESINDDEALVISNEVAKEIETSMNYPGQIKVTVLRETRAVAYAK